MLFNILYNNKAGMDIETHKFRQLQNHHLGSSITCLSSNSEYLATGSLDDTLRIWRNKIPLSRQPQISNSDQISSIIDIALSKSHVASLSMDSTIKIWDLDTRISYNIDVPMFYAWKLAFLEDNLVTCGDLGRIYFYDIISREVVKKFQVGDYFLTSIAKKQDTKNIAVGNANGDLFIVSTQNRQESVPIKAHYKSILSIALNAHQNCALTGSDDTTISSVDLTKSKKIRSFEGHEEKVTCVKNYSPNNKLLLSTSADRTLRLWDHRVKDQVAKYLANGALNGVEVSEKSIFIGSQTGTLQVLTL